MNEHQITPKSGNQQNLPSKDNLKDNQPPTGNEEQKDSETSERTVRQDFPERTHQHDYKNPSANQNEGDKEDGIDKDEETDTVNKQTDVSDLGLV